MPDEDERPASWGGSYSVFSTSLASKSNVPAARLALAREAVDADPVELELAATAAFLAANGSNDPWWETQKRKPDKVRGGRIEKAKELYKKLASVRTPKKLPSIGG